jgi:hypothetical protein
MKQAVAARGMTPASRVQDARDLAIMRREIQAARRADGSIVTMDIRGRRHEANVAARWVITRARKHKEARAKDQLFDEAGYCANISILVSRRWTRGSSSYGTGRSMCDAGRLLA